MKSSSLPSVRVEPELREQLEQVLLEGESLSAFVEASVRDSVKRRLDQVAFVQRGIASLDAARASGNTVSAEVMVQRLEQRLATARAAKRQRAIAQRG